MPARPERTRLRGGRARRCPFIPGLARLWSEDSSFLETVARYAPGLCEGLRFGRWGWPDDQAVLGTQHGPRSLSTDLRRRERFLA